MSTRKNDTQPLMSFQCTRRFDRHSVCINLNFRMWSCNDKQFPKTLPFLAQAAVPTKAHCLGVKQWQRALFANSLKLTRDVWLLWWCCLHYMTLWPASQPKETSGAEQDCTSSCRLFLYVLGALQPMTDKERAGWRTFLSHRDRNCSVLLPSRTVRDLVGCFCTC